MSRIPINKKYLLACVVLGVLLCAAQITGNSLFVLGCLALFLVLLAWCCSINFTIPILLFFLPWSPILRLDPNSYSFYTFGMVLICLLGAIKTSFSFRRYQIKAGIILVLFTLLSKLLDGSSLSFDYIAFIMMIVLFPTVCEETRNQKYDFYQVVIFFSTGIIVASLCAMYFADYANIRKFIKIDAYLTILRRCGFYGDANFYAVQVLAAMGGALSLTLQGMKKRQVFLLGIIILFLLYCGFLSGSKSFVLVAALILLLWFVAIFKIQGKPGLKIVLFVFGVASTIYVATSFLFRGLIDVIITRFSSTTDFNSFTTGRIGVWKSYIHEIVSNAKVFFLGQGFTNIKVNGRGSHNTIVQAFYQFGMIGVPVIIYWVVCFFQEKTRTIQSGKLMKLKTLIIVVGTFVPWLAIDMLFFDDFFLLQMYMCLAIYTFRQDETQRISIETECVSRGKKYE